MQILEQRISQFMVSVITAVFVGRFVYYYSKAPEMAQQSHPGFYKAETKLSTVDRVTFAWSKANTGR